ncbi:hypothetical protein [Bradyrhizobium lablabi]|uniref:hypothetical protein n=1 Tax=Bradyrhizobium lablabi TaxID=722472 RepID=UPI001BAD5E14|nr:hypothetical protein [Bradyrhizobium lablabi]MBR0694617.1 hypothetical protein [Bradyrhizobium lablabi]
MRRLAEWIRRVVGDRTGPDAQLRQQGRLLAGSVEKDAQINGKRFAQNNAR